MVWTSRGSGEVCELLRGLKERGKTILIAAHNMLEIEWLCDTICEMDARCPDADK